MNHDTSMPGIGLDGDPPCKGRLIPCNGVVPNHIDKKEIPEPGKGMAPEGGGRSSNGAAGGHPTVSEMAFPEGIERHPCYNLDQASRYGRIHLPVAPRCNLGCNYCQRRYDCLNESRPGVCSQIMKPREALHHLLRVRAQMPEILVAGIAGPGDALADWNNSRETLELISGSCPDMMLCLATNGLKLDDLADEMLALGIRHVTVTVNAASPETAARIYSYVNYQGHRWRGIQAGELLLQKQTAGIARLARGGASVKINSVLIPGVNDQEIPAVMAKMARLGAAIGNIIPFIPVPGALWQDWEPPNQDEVNLLRRRCQTVLPQMSHCGRCRADALGLIGA